MEKKSRIAISTLLTICMIIAGCATPPKILKEEDIGGIRKLAVVTSLSDTELQILDHTGIGNISYYEPYYDPQFHSLSLGQAAAVGAIAGLLEGLIEAGIREVAIKSSLGGEPDALREAVRDFSVKEVFDDNFARVFSLGREIVRPQEIEGLEIGEYPEREAVGGETIRDYTVLSKRLGVDTVLEIDFRYGLAAYGGGVSASAVIAGVVSVTDIKDNKLLMRKTISSDAYYRKGYTVEDFKANGAELFRKESVEAIRGFARLVAAEFGEELSLKHKSYWRPEK